MADPKFVDADHDNYRLKADSPALQLGFKPIPMDKIGPYQDKLRPLGRSSKRKGPARNPFREGEITVKEMIAYNFPDSNVSGALCVPPANGTRSVPDTFVISRQFLNSS